MMSVLYSNVHIGKIRKSPLGCENLLKPILTSVDLASLDLQLELSEIGQFADLAHGTLSSEL